LFEEQPEVVEEEPVNEEVGNTEVRVNREVYETVLSTRAERNQLRMKKNDLSGEIKSLLEQVKSGLVTREYAVPKINGLKQKVAEIKEKEDKFDNIPEVLPIEELNDQIKAAERRLDKIDDLKNDDKVSKETVREAKRRADESLTMLRSQKSTIVGYLRQWKKELQEELEVGRKEIEHLYVRYKTDEITEERYQELKEELVDTIEKNDRIIQMIDNLTR
jgi:chromosome segregation ATPase